jgi:hypothetical protein
MVKVSGLWARNVDFSTRFARWCEAQRRGLIVDYVFGDIVQAGTPWLYDPDAARLLQSDLPRFEAELARVQDTRNDGAAE